MATKLKHNFVYQFLLSSTQVLLPLATYPYITRILGPENIGKINYIDFSAQIFMIIAAFGIPFYGTREIAKLRNNPIARSKLLKELTIVHSTLAVVCACLFVLLFRQKLLQEKTLGMLAIANILISACSFDWYIMGMEQFRFAAIRTIAIRVLMLVGCFTLVKEMGDYPWFFGLFTGAMLLTAVANGIYAYRQQPSVSAPLQFSQHIKPLFHFFLTASAVGIYEYVGTIILEKLVQSELLLGYYTMMHKIILVILAMMIALSGVLSPRVSYLIAHQQHEDAQHYMTHFLELILAISIPACTGIFIYAPELVQVIAGDQFAPAVPILRILCFMPLVVGPTNIFCNQVLVAFHQEQKFMVVALLGCVVSIVANFALVPLLSAEGTAFASMFTETIVALVSGWMAFRYIQLRFDVKAIVQCIAVSLLFWPLAVGIRTGISHPLGVVAAGVSSSALLYFTLQLWIFKNRATTSIVNQLKTIVKGKQS